MDAFSYTDIFDTKGIEYLVVIAFLLVVIPVWFALNRPVKEKVALHRSASGLSAGILKILPGLYYSRNHTWAHLEKTGAARIGLDDLLLHLTGGVSVEFLKKEGEKVREGEPVLALKKEDKSLLIKSPMSGDVLKVNHRAAQNEGLIHDDPYGKGWLMQLKPWNWRSESVEYYLDKEAEKWSEQELLKCKDFFAEAVAGTHDQPVLQAGGELIDFPLSEMPEEVWKQFQKKFLD
jgi:glycine cleavage system H protein